MRLYYLYRIAGESRAQREVRILNAFGMVYSYLAKFSNAYYSILRKYTKKANTSTELQAVLGFLRDFFTYYILAKNAALGKISTGDFIFYLTLVVGFSEWLNNFTGHIMSLKRISIGCGKYREFVDEKKDEDKKPDIDAINDIELKNLSFQYDEDSKILKNINLSMKRGDSVAIVGENGAGKTTFINLLTGLYRPTSGEIFVNGKTPTLENTSKEAGVVSQDFFLFSFMLGENVAASRDVDMKNAALALETSGFGDKYWYVPQKLDKTGGEMDYTKEYKKTKVKEYLNSKDSLSKFIQKNNIPKSTLQDWIKIYNEYGPDAFMDSNKRNTLTLQEQNNLVELYLREKTNLTTFAKSHGIPPMTFSGWLYKYYENLLPEYIRRESQDLSKKKKQTKNKYKDIEITDEIRKKLEEQEEKIIRLEIENAYLKELRRLRLQKKLKQKQELPKTSEDNTH